MQEEQDGKGLFKRLRKLFSTDVIIRNVGGKQLKVIDTDNLQSSGNLANNSRVDRYQRMHGGSMNSYSGDGAILQGTIKYTKYFTTSFMILLT